MKKVIALMLGGLLFGAGTAFAQYDREYSFEEVDTDGDGKISIEEAKAHPGFVDESIYHTFNKARGQSGHSDNWDMPIEEQEWEGLTTH